jgi:hypothetical protein
VASISDHPRVNSLLQKDALYISDPLALHTILVRDQYTFPESREFSGFVLYDRFSLDTLISLISLFGLIHHGDSFASAAGMLDSSTLIGR